MGTKILTVILTALILISGCVQTTGNLAARESIKIGAIFMLSGVGSNWGENSQRGADMAVEEINNQGGINGKLLEMVYEDNKGDNPQEALTALQRFIAADIKIVLGPNWSPSGNAVAPVACDNKVLMISPSLGVADFNERCGYLFNLWPHDDALSRALGKYLYESGYRRIAVLGSLQTWEQVQAFAVKEGFENTGGSVVSFQLAQNDEKDFRAEVLKIKESGAEALVFTDYAYEHLSAKRAREIGITAQFFSVLIDDDRIQGAEGTFEETIVITSFTPSQNFTDKFVAKYGAQPDIGSDTSYDAVMLIVKAIKETNSTDPTILKNYINSLESYHGVSGNLKFDGKGGVTKRPKLTIVKNNMLIPYEG